MKCENTRLMCVLLWRLNIVAEKNVDSLVENEMLCNPVTELCRFRKCDCCREKVVQILEFEGDEECYHEAWLTLKEVGRDGREHRQTRKTKVYCTQLELVKKFIETILPQYLDHRAIDSHQKSVMKEFKQTLTNCDMLNHVDFAENYYSCKYFEEIQSVHFGGNRDQVSLHTGVMYSGKWTQAFCTVSGDLKHDAVAIFFSPDANFDRIWCWN